MVLIVDSSTCVGRIYIYIHTHNVIPQWLPKSGQSSGALCCVAEASWFPKTHTCHNGAQQVSFPDWRPSRKADCRGFPFQVGVKAPKCIGLRISFSCGFKWKSRGTPTPFWRLPNNRRTHFDTYECQGISHRYRKQVSPPNKNKQDVLHFLHRFERKTQGSKKKTEAPWLGQQDEPGQGRSHESVLSDSHVVPCSVSGIRFFRLCQVPFGVIILTVSGGFDGFWFHDQSQKI